MTRRDFLHRTTASVAASSLSRTTNAQNARSKDGDRHDVLYDGQALPRTHEFLEHCNELELQEFRAPSTATSRRFAPVPSS